MRAITIAIPVLLISVFSLAQPPADKKPRELPAKRTTLPVKVDGLLDDEAWKDAAMFTDLIEFRPKVGAREAYENRTESWIMYNDEGIYFGGYCYERTKDSIARELTGRDGFGTNDYVGIIIDTYKDKLNGFEYFVTPLGEQWDSKMSPVNNNNGGEDFSWNAVWESGAVIHDDGWSFEMFIPYSAIRFGKKEVQDWGINITRRRRKTEQQYTWNPIDPTVNGFLTQEGFWTGITNIKPPLRLQFSPYFSIYANHFPLNIDGEKNWTSQVNGGLDLKYGINQAFTLDATLIPDFGQVQSDNRVLNLTPFDVQFNENRSFFTEGTELFGKGGFFYSRRIGVEPILLHNPGNSLGANEEIVKFPGESKLINASKISGRTQKGLGIGVLNAITKARYATIEDLDTKNHRRELVDPLTNYNVLVLDQTFKHNSSVSLINTSVIRSGKDYDANVTAALFNFSDKSNHWNVNGKVASSNLVGYLPDGKTLSGYGHQVEFGKNSGRFTFSVWEELTDTRYTHRDLGYFTNNNFLNHGGYVGYSWIEPHGFYNRIFLNVNGNYNNLLTQIKQIDETYQSARINANLNIQSKKLWWIGGHVDYNFSQNDFYEPRREGNYFRRGASIGFGTWFESNNAKKYSFYTENFARRYLDFYNSFALDLFLNQNYRFNSRFSLSHRISLQPRFNNIGYAWSEDGSDIVFARRKVRTVENILGAKYSFNNKMWITFRARHYMSTVENKEFFMLMPTGKLTRDPGFAENVDRNANFFNIDMVYTWQFAPGSFINIVWKNAIQHYTDVIEEGYFKNLSNTIDSDQNNNISLKVIYFLDYLQLRNKHKEHKAKE